MRLRPSLSRHPWHALPPQPRKRSGPRAAFSAKYGHETAFWHENAPLRRSRFHATWAFSLPFPSSGGEKPRIRARARFRGQKTVRNPHESSASSHTPRKRKRASATSNLGSAPFAAVPDAPPALAKRRLASNARRGVPTSASARRRSPAPRTVARPKRAGTPRQRAAYRSRSRSFVQKPRIVKRPRPIRARGAVY
ncbi:hypothetical protein BN3658_01911 [Coriobacteriaceae bacterium CHKCI002]|nr:hypothetical protein BN3658_01911 [Coriobacteriaceae bacterium CHKCI002]